MKKLSDKRFQNAEITFGEEIPVDEISDAVILPVIINGEEMSVDDIKFTISPEYLDHKIYYRPDILIAKELRGQGLGYNIYKAFIHEFGNIISPDSFRENKTEIPKIYDRLSKEPDIIVQKKIGGYLAYLKGQN